MKKIKHIKTITLFILILILSGCNHYSVHSELKAAIYTTFQLTKENEGEIKISYFKQNWDTILICSPYSTGLKNQQINKSLLIEILSDLESSKKYYLFVIKEKKIVEKAKLTLPMSIPSQKGYIYISQSNPKIYYLSDYKEKHVSLFETKKQLETFKSGDLIY